MLMKFQNLNLLHHCFELSDYYQQKSTSLLFALVLLSSRAVTPCKNANNMKILNKISNVLFIFHILLPHITIL